jgi:beta-galactosidase beta subunit
VAEKHNFCGIQRKIRQESDFANNRDMNLFPHGETAADPAKMFAQFFAKIGFRYKKCDFCKNPIG